MNNLVNLRFQRIIILLVVISQCKHRDPRYEIQISFAVYIVKIYALSFIKHDLITVVRM